MTTVSVNLTVDLSQVTHQTLTQAIAAFMKVIDGKQEALINLDPVTGRSTNKALSQAEIEDIANKLNGQEERKAKKAARKQREPLTDEQKMIVRSRLLEGKLRAAKARGDKQAVAQIREKLAELNGPSDDEIKSAAKNLTVGKAKARIAKTDPEAERLATASAVRKVVKGQQLEDAGEDLPIVKSKKGVVVETRYADGSKKVSKK